MADLSTKYLGLDLKNPVIIGSSGLTENLEGLKDAEKFGAAAVVLKSLFEEEIIIELEQQKKAMNTPGHIFPEIFDMFNYDDVEDSVSKYLYLIEQAKKELSIPVIASVNCVSANEWTVFAKRIQKAGADALELNIFIQPTEFFRSSEEKEKVYFEVIEKVKKEISIPIAVKISYYFSNLGKMIQKLSDSGADALVLFNRFFSPDFDIDKMTVVPTNIYSNPNELSNSLRWIAIMAGKVKADLAASTGVHDGKALIKQILAGADAVQVVSTIYKNGFASVTNMLDELSSWMEQNGYSSLADFKGKLSQAESLNPAAYERMQFMKYFSGKHF